MPKWFGYVRVSSIDQAAHGHSIDAQISALNASYERTWKAKGYEFGEIYVDAAQSASIPIFQRVAGHRLKTEPVKGDVVEFTQIDRAFRSTHDASATWKHFRTAEIGMSFLDMPMLGDMTPTAKFFFDILSAFAELDLSMRKERCKAGVIAAKKKGVVFGATWVTCKWQNNNGKRRFVPDPDRLELAQFIIQWRDVEGLTWDAIVRRLRDMKIPSMAREGNYTFKRNRKFMAPGAIITPHAMEASRLYAGGKKTIRWIEDGKMPQRVGSWVYDPLRATRSLAPGRGKVKAEGVGKGQESDRGVGAPDGAANPAGIEPAPGGS